MKVLIVNTSDKTGGAAVAASRLMHALKGEGISVKMLVRDKETTDNDVLSLAQDEKGKRIGWLRKAAERLFLLPRLGFSRKNLWAIDEGRLGYDITKHEAFADADVVHLHWVNQGMMSVKDISRLLKSGKRIIWTMHDLWPATSICHYADACQRFHSHCSHCPLLTNSGSSRDISFTTWERKAKAYSLGRITFVCCSHWLERQAKASALLSGHAITSIPNPIDTRVFYRKDQKAARQRLGLPTDKRIVLFVSQKVTDERKGACYFIEAINQLSKGDNATQNGRNDIAVAILGGNAEEVSAQLNVPSYPLGYVSDVEKITDIYNSADCFCLPSLQDNLPNTIMEAMACGMPCVGFNIGGVPEMIDHEVNGYIAEARKSNELADGIRYCLSADNHERLSGACLEKVNTAYSEHAVAQKFIKIYEDYTDNMHL